MEKREENMDGQRISPSLLSGSRPLSLHGVSEAYTRQRIDRLLLSPVLSISIHLSIQRARHTDRQRERASLSYRALAETLTV